MPSIIIKEIDETSAGTTAIVNDVAYVPGFSNNNSFVVVGGTNGTKKNIQFVSEGSPENFVPQLRVYQYTPTVGDSFTVKQTSQDTTGTSINVTSVTTDGYTYKVGGGTAKEGSIVLGQPIKFLIPSLVSVFAVEYNGNAVLYVQSGDEVASTGELYVRSAIVGDYYYDKSQQDLYVASNAPNSGSEIEIVGTATVTPTGTAHTATLAVGDIEVSSVVTGDSATPVPYTQNQGSITMTFTSDSEATVTVTGSVISKGGLIGVENPTTSVAIGGLTVGGTGTSVSVDTDALDSSDYTVANNTVTFTKIFWNYIGQSNADYVVTYVPENIPTYCSTKAQFERLFGAYPYYFDKNQAYEGFSPDAAIPKSVMFKAGEADPSYVYAKELICAGIPVYYDNVVHREDDGTRGITSVEDIYERLGLGSENGGSFDELADPNEYNVKYITSGGYPIFEKGYSSEQGGDNIGIGLVENMLKIATQGVVDDTGETSNAGRGDIVALIDHTNNPQRQFTGQGSVFYVLGGVGAGGEVTLRTDSAVAKLQSADCDLSYGTMFTPWFKYTTKYTDGYKDGRNIGKFVIKMPASFAYLMDLASSIKTNPSWMAIAGVNRAQVVNYTGRTTAEVLTAKIAQNFQLRKDTTSINPITEIRPYGQCIWGNRTLKPHIEGLTATNFLNIRNLVCDVKKTVYRAAKRCMFEQDTQVLWINFKSQITPILDQMTTGQGISAYKVVRVPTTEKAKFIAKVILYPIYAIEDIEVTVVMRDEEVSVTSNEQ